MHVNMHSIRNGVNHFGSSVGVGISRVEVPPPTFCNYPALDGYEQPHSDIDVYNSMIGHVDPPSFEAPSFEALVDDDAQSCGNAYAKTHGCHSIQLLPALRFMW